MSFTVFIRPLCGASPQGLERELLRSNIAYNLDPAQMGPVGQTADHGYRLQVHNNPDRACQCAQHNGFTVVSVDGRPYEQFVGQT